MHKEREAQLEFRPNFLLGSKFPKKTLHQQHPVEQRREEQLQLTEVSLKLILFSFLSILSASPNTWAQVVLDITARELCVAAGQLKFPPLAAPFSTSPLTASPVVQMEQSVGLCLLCCCDPSLKYLSVVSQTHVGFAGPLKQLGGDAGWDRSFPTVGSAQPEDRASLGRGSPFALLSSNFSSPRWRIKL